ncbi:hypothetical protein FACS1894140_2440 [Spirochaetia bacterium]|nr:hypothetical protein FACS1894140_2440 [Spirochaetia bacterium]
MSDTVNPWQSPGAVTEAERDAASSQALTNTMVRYLKEAAPWLRFIGILSFIGCGFMFAGGIIFVILASVVSGLAGEFEAIGGALVGLIYIPMGVLMFFPARFIYNFGAKIRNYARSNAEQDLEEALKNNKSLWKFYGIMSIISLALIPVGTIVAIVIAVTSSFL